MTPRARQAGFTLIEMLVVLSIIGVMAGVAVLGLGGAGRGDAAESEARRLAGRLQLAADQSLVADRGLALTWDAGGYGFARWDVSTRSWTADGTTALGERHILARGVALRASGAAQPALIDPQSAQPLDIVLTGSGGAWRVSFDGLNVQIVREPT